MRSSSGSCLEPAVRSPKSPSWISLLALARRHVWGWSKLQQTNLFAYLLLIFLSIPSFHALIFLCWPGEDAAMIEHTLELQFRMDDVEDNNRDERKHAHSDENRYEEEGKQQNDYEKWKTSQCLRSRWAKMNRCQYCRDRSKVEVHNIEKESESRGYDRMWAHSAVDVLQAAINQRKSKYTVHGDSNTL